MIQLFAQPYDVSATGFYFESAEQYEARVAKAANRYGEPVDEFEIQFIDGDDLDCSLARAWGLSQGSIAAFFEATETWDEDQKVRFVIAVGECGYSFDPQTDAPDGYDVDLYDVDSMRELAKQFVDEGLFGDIPERLRFYLDYEAIARDLSMDYTETVIAGQPYAYRCG
uniref:antirestriction protein ArdA n=1 Tax=Stappia sp. TaxID=1870903 RepID=UPI003BAA9CCE